MGKFLELIENIKDAYMLMAMDDVPENHEVKEFALPFTEVAASSWRPLLIFTETSLLLL